MKITEYTLTSSEVARDYTFVLLSDLHNVKYDTALRYTLLCHPDAILVAGDIVERHRKQHSRALPFLEDCVKIAPTFFSLGNHEVKYPVLSSEMIESTGVTLLDNSWTLFENDILIGGLTSKTEDINWLRDFEDNDQYSILLCHHPEYYDKFLKDHDIDLILSGHAHGGQWRFFERGIFSPGQGLFPKYTKGLYDEKMLVGTGISNTGFPIPRINNPKEVIKITIKKQA